MTLALTPEQHELTAAVTRFADRHAPVDKTRGAFEALAAGEVPTWWDDLVANGFHAVHLPEEIGGQGGGLADAACVIEAAAAALLPGPLLSTVTAGAVAQLAGGPGAQSVLRELAAGATATVVGPEGSGLRAGRGADGWQVSGSSAVTLGLLSARTVLVGTPADDGVLWFVLDPTAASARREAVAGTDLTVDAGVLHLDGHPVTADEELAGIDAERARCLTVALIACATAGITQWCVQAVTEHLRTREQFGKPIGTFQALQHKAALLLVGSELATAAAWDAVRAAGEPLTQHRIAAAGAAVRAVAPVPDAVLDTLTMFGAIGFTWEHDLHLYWRRAISLAASIGPVPQWKQRLGELTRGHTRDMSLNLGDTEADFRARVAAVLDRAAALHNDGPARQGDYPEYRTGPQRTLLADAGLIAPHWPAPWGLDAGQLQLLIIEEEFDRRPEVVRPSVGIAEWILPSILRAGAPELCERFAPATLRGELAWCQLFSEPGAGSDLASLTTRAVKVDGGWRVTGHKIWTSAAHRADYGALLARTDPDAPKHRGIGYFVVDMASDGVEVHPITTATGDAHFNEVFLTDVFVPDEMLLGEPTGGWDLAIATMATERLAISNYVKMDRAAALRELARTSDDPALWQALGESDAHSNAIKALAVRETLRLLDGQAPGPASSIAKVATNLMLRNTFRSVLEHTAPRAMTADSQPPVVESYLHLPAELVGGGTTEIQLNIIAQVIMGLPRK